MEDYNTEKVELLTFIDNDEMLYEHGNSIQKNIVRKVMSGKYDAKKAPKLWQYLVDAGAKAYAKMGHLSVREVFPKDLRVHMAKELAEEFEGTECFAEAKLAAKNKKKVTKRKK